MCLCILSSILLGRISPETFIKLHYYHLLKQLLRLLHRVYAKFDSRVLLQVSQTDQSYFSCFLAFSIIYIYVTLSSTASVKYRQHPFSLGVLVTSKSLPRELGTSAGLIFL